MNIAEITIIVDRINDKIKKKAEFEALKLYVDDRTNSNGGVTIRLEDRSFDVDPTSLKKILDDKIAEQDTKDDEAELKLKAK